MQDFLIQIQPILVSLGVAVITALVAILSALLLKVRVWIISKIGQTDFDSAFSAGKGIYLWIRDNHPEWTPAQKIEEMKRQLLTKFPSLSQIEIDAINKEVHNLYKAFSEGEVPEPKTDEEVEFVAEPTPTEG
jgi:hypothetical protein